MMKMNFSLSTKLFINNIFYAIPILVLLYLMLNTYNKELLFSQKELLGNEIQKSTMELLQQVIKKQTFQAEMEPAFKKMMSEFDQYNEDLLLDDESLKARKREHIQKEKLLANFEAYKAGKIEPVKMIKDLRELVIHTGDTSNLILDPDLDSYYLMDVTLIVAPQIAERLYDIRQMLKELSSNINEPLTEAEKIKTAVMLAMVKESDWGRIYASTATAINEDKNFFGSDVTLQNDVKNHLEKSQAEFNVFFTALEEISKGDKTKTATARDISDKLIDEAHSFYLVSNQTLTNVIKTREAAIISNRNNGMTIGILAVLIALAVSLFTSKNFKTGTRKISEALSQLMGAVTINAEASEKLTESSNSLSSVSTQQASAVQETVSSLYEINSMSERNSESIKLSTQKSDLGKEHAINGKNAINKMAATIKNISETNNKFFSEIQTSNEELRIIVKIISDISERTKVINDIVFQTRLLSFNASVEAARAGEHGKGFAVVAEEIGKLALISGNSAKEINDILVTATTQVETIISNMSSRVGALTENAQAELLSGEIITSECVSSLNDIVVNISELCTMMNEVTLAINEQTKGYSEITKAIGQIDEGIHHGLGLSQETSASAKQLFSQVTELKRIVKTIEKEVLGVEVSA